MAGALNPTQLQSLDQYYVQDVEFISGNDSISIKNLMQEFSIYEDIFKPAITGNILITDSIGLINALKITGTEKIRLSFGKKSSTDVELVTKEFRIIRLGPRVKKSFTTEIYSIHFCSDELVISESRKVSKAYVGKTIDDIVVDILDNYLDLAETDKNYTVQKTDGVYDFTIPLMKPFEAINFVASYARGLNGNNNVYDFMFFENKDGFVFVSLEKLYQQAPFASYGYSPKNYFSPDTQAGLSYGNSIKSYTFLDTFDSLYGVSTGAFANRVITIDPMTKQYYVDNFDYIQYFNNTKHLNDKPIISSISGDFASSYDAVVKVLTTNKNQEKALGISDKPGSVAKDSFIADRIRYRTAQIPLSMYTRMKLSIPGDPNITVGNVIYIELPLITENQTGGIDEYHSGKYLVTAVRQIIDTNMEYETILEVAKESYQTPVAKNEV